MENKYTIEKLIDSINSLYGAFKIEFCSNKGDRYWVYGFKDEEKSWDFDQGELLLVTDDVNLINIFQKGFKTISNNERFCRCCFEKKKVEKFDDGVKCWVKKIEEWVPKDILTDIQSRLLMFYPELKWRNIQNVTVTNLISYGLCTNCYTDEELNQLNYRNFKKVINQSISNYIFYKNDESVLEKYLIENIELIEKGMKFIECQKRMGNGAGVIDILAEDRNGRTCIIELKTNSNDKNVVWQAAFYQTDFGNDARVIIIKPNYTKGIYNALKNVRNTELKFYELDNNYLIQIKDYQDKVDLITDNALVVNI